MVTYKCADDMSPVNRDSEICEGCKVTVVDFNLVHLGINETFK